MTREEAKGRLLDIQNRLNMTFRTVQEQEEYTALEMAIKALVDKGHDRKKARRFKNKYLKLKTAVGKIKAEIESCRNMYFKNHDGTPTDNLYNYCPNCGAEMIGDTE